MERDVSRGTNRAKCKLRAKSVESKSSKLLAAAKQSKLLLQSLHCWALIIINLQPLSANNNWTNHVESVDE